MAEAIGLASSIISLVSLCLTVSQVSYDYISKTRHSSTTISRYLQEILALSSSLLKLQETLALPGVAAAVGTGAGKDDLLPRGLVEESTQELQAIKAKLERKLNGGAGGGRRAALGGKLDRLTWPFQEKETEEMVAKLSRWNGICAGIVASYNLYVFLQDGRMVVAGKRVWLTERRRVASETLEQTKLHRDGKRARAACVCRC
jgi:hypothetical protein